METNKIYCGDSLTVEQDLFQSQNGGSIPTSPLQLEIRPILYKTALICYKRWHYLKDVQFLSTQNYGAYYEGRIKGAISFGSPNATEIKGLFNRYTQRGYWEIKRLAMSEECPKNSESRFIAIAIKLLRKKFNVRGIITYADSGVGHTGIIYKASGFTYKGLSTPKMDFWIEGKIQQRGKTKNKKGEWKHRNRKHLFIKLFNPSIIGDEIQETPTPHP